MRDSMVFYRSFADALSELPAEEYKEAVQAMLDYALDGKEPECGGVAKALYIMAKPQIDANNKRYENGKKGGAKPNDNQTGTKQEPNPNQTITKQEPNHNQNTTKAEPNVNVNDNVNVNENVNVNDIKSKRTRFTPPTKEDIQDYCAQKGLNIDADRFIDYYSAQGWKLSNGNAMKDWRAAVRNWSRDKKPRAPAPKPKNRFNDFDQRTYSDKDYKAIEDIMKLRGGHHG